jgi:serine/threonine protein kinase
MAAKSSDFQRGGIVSGLIGRIWCYCCIIHTSIHLEFEICTCFYCFPDLNFNGVCTRWAAPESLLDGRYSIYSDVWSVNILADEILNYAAWPFSDISDADIDDMIINVRTFMLVKFSSKFNELVIDNLMLKNHFVIDCLYSPQTTRVQQTETSSGSDSGRTCQRTWPKTKTGGVEGKTSWDIGQCQWGRRLQWIWYVSSSRIPIESY